MTYEEKKAFDLYAAAALSALISKLPLIDREGEFSEKTAQEDVTIIHKEIANSALWYASHMMEFRKEHIDYISAKNKEAQ